ERYQSRLAASGGLDFGDLLMKAVELLRDHERVRSYYQEHFHHLLVDEYQDTNHAQHSLTKTLAAKHRQVCCVGDPDQSIYAWRGAHVGNILDFDKDFPDAKVVRLERNYRSTPDILKAAVAVISNNRRRPEKTLWTDRPAGHGVESQELPDEREEARFVTARIVRLAEQGMPLSDIAVFYRTNAQSRSFEEALRLARLPYRVVGTVRFYERKEVKDALAYCRAALNPADSISLSRIINVPSRGVGKASLDALEERMVLEDAPLFSVLGKADSIEKLTPAARRAARELRSLIEGLGRDMRSLSPSAALESALRRTGYLDWLRAEAVSDPSEAARLDNVQELVNAVREFEESRPGEGLERYLEDVALQSGADEYEAGRPAVTLMTVHLAKGLEFPAVFLTGLEEGLFPISRDGGDPDELEEERRLCYVGMTRARERLLLTYAATRRLFGRVYANLPSRFILEAGLLGGRRTSQTEVNGIGPGNGEPSTRQAALRVRVGLRVRHPEFGMGRVVAKDGSGEGLKVTVAFDSGATRKLLVRYAPLLPA
ncbi:MAG: 3'-5' exonuclease, partial [Elusimicrobiota bacterium]